MKRYDKTALIRRRLIIYAVAVAMTLLFLGFAPIWIHLNSWFVFWVEMIFPVTALAIAVAVNRNWIAINHASHIFIFLGVSAACISSIILWPIHSVTTFYSFSVFVTTAFMLRGRELILWFLVCLGAILLANRLNQAVAIPADYPNLRTYADLYLVGILCVLMAVAIYIYEFSGRFVLSRMERAKVKKRRLLAQLQVMQQQRADYFQAMKQELNQPILIMQQISASIMDNGLSDEEKKQHIELLEAVSLYMANMLSDVLHFNPAKNIEFTVRFEEFRLRDWCAQMWQCCQMIAQAKQMPCELKLSNDLPQVMLSDAYKLLQVITNLLMMHLEHRTATHLLIEVQWLEDQRQVSFSINGGSSAGHSANAAIDWADAPSLLVTRDLLHKLGGHFMLDTAHQSHDTVAFQVPLTVVN